VKKTVAGIVALLLSAIATLHLPTNSRLELYEVGDLTYSMDGPSVDISLATRDPVEPILEVYLIFTGEDLVHRLRPLVPGAEELMQFQNGLLIVRGTAMQHLAVRAALLVHRVRNAAVFWSIDAISRAKAALSARLFGMITR